MAMRRLVTTSNKDYYGGALMIAIGLGAVIQARQYPIGTLSRMGPGFFPIALGAILAFTGLAIIVTARFAAHAAEDARLPPEWRGWLCIGLSLIAFVSFGKYGGLVPATFAVVFIAALADRENTIVAAMVLALATVAICIVVFWWALQMNFPLFGWG
jgi:hypothetical protein